MVAGKSREDLKSCIPVPGETYLKLLPVAAIYGANAAGKTTLLLALQWLQGCVRGFDLPARPFRLDSAWMKQPTECLISMFIDGEVWEYHFAKIGHRVVRECLKKVTRNGDIPLYDRWSEKFCLGRGLNLEAETRSFAENLGRNLPENKVYLSTVVDLCYPGLTEQLLPAYMWLCRHLCIVGAGSGRLRLSEVLCRAPDLYSAALRSVDTGVEMLRKVPIPKEEAGFSEQEIESFRDSEDNVLYSDHGSTWLVKNKGNIKAYQWVALHPTNKSGSFAQFDLERESEGTRRFLDLLPIILDDRESSHTVYVVDELNRSLHPSLVRELLRRHLEHVRAGKHRQLIFTTHDTQLMDQDILRKDEFWFIEKHEDGASHIFSLSDFRTRSDLNIRKSYLEGRFGALPELRNFSVNQA